MVMAISLGSMMTVYGDHHGSLIEIAPGGGRQGCEDIVNGCFTPEDVVVDINSYVTFRNTSEDIHTFTAGSLFGGNTDEFKSAFLQPGEGHGYYPSRVGIISYYCMVHPWEVGTLIIEDLSTTPGLAIQSEINKLLLEVAELNEQIIPIEEDIAKYREQLSKLNL